MWKKMTARLLILFFLLGVLPASYGQQYIESTVWSARVAEINQNQLALNVQLNNGPGSYSYNIFYGDCSGEAQRVKGAYLILPRFINLGGVSIPMKWSGNIVGDIDGAWDIVLNTEGSGGGCYTSGSSYSSASIGVNATGVGDLTTLAPGDYTYSLTYYVGNAFAPTNSDVVSLIKNRGLNGSTSSTPTKSFTGVAACAQDSPTSGTTIDFGTVTSNGTLQPGPLTTLGLVCNYDVALNDVTYSLTSNNPVTGEPSTGQNVAVALTNGATVTLDGGNVTQPDPKKVSVNITPSIDTRGAIAGEGTGSATLTFTYE